MAERIYDIGKLKGFGFLQEGKDLIYRCSIAKGDFEMVVVFDGTKTSFDLFDSFSGDKYTLHLVKRAHGQYVALIKEETATVMARIEGECSVPGEWRDEATLGLMKAIKDRFGEIPDNPFSDSGAYVYRRADNRKWYALVMKVRKDRFFEGADGEFDVMNIRVNQLERDSLIDYDTFFPAYHMNKKNWISLVISKLSSMEEALRLVGESRELAKKR